MIKFKLKVRDCNRGPGWVSPGLKSQDSARLGLRFPINLYSNFKLMDDEKKLKTFGLLLYAVLYSP